MRCTKHITHNHKLYQIQVLLPLAINHELTYLSYEPYAFGQIVVVPFRRGESLGVVTECCSSNDATDINKEKDDVHIDNSANEIDQTQNKKYTLKYIIRPLDILPLPSGIIEFIKWVANYNMVPSGMVLKMMLSTLSRHYNKKPRKAKTIPSQNIDDYLQYDDIALSDAQLIVADKILSSFSANNNTAKVHVIHGITGSGKTEAYLRVAQEVLRSGKQVLILAPEILLTTQLKARFEQKVGSLCEWHSDISTAQKWQIWQGIHNGLVRFIVGARSALFLPFANLGLIIIDEEHDSSYKQDEGIIYHARDMAVVFASIMKIPLILSSATPSIETVHNANIGKYTMHRLHSRYTGVMMPNVTVADMNNTVKNSILHPTAIEKIKTTIEQKKQVLIFINRRGYAPIIFCPNCGNKAKCKICSFWLVYHKKSDTMQCHYCGFSSQYFKQCLECNSTKTSDNDDLLKLATQEEFIGERKQKTEICIAIDEDINVEISKKLSSATEFHNTILYGCGVERVEEEINKLFPTAKSCTITSDHVKSQKEASNIISNIINQNVDIIIGTQILAKGLNFPNLHLVIVLNANPSYLSADIRVLEKTYQLLYQVIGRAGRAHIQGEVVLQTMEPRSQILLDLASYDQDKFIATELKNRKAAHAPPFSRMAIITCSGYDELVVRKAMDSLRTIMPESTELCLILGPAPAPILQIRGYYRYRFVVCASLTINIQRLLLGWISAAVIPSSVNIRIDVDPQYFA